MYAIKFIFPLAHLSDVLISSSSLRRTQRTGGFSFHPDIFIKKIENVAYFCERPSTVICKPTPTPQPQDDPLLFSVLIIHVTKDKEGKWVGTKISEHSRF